MAIYKSDMLDFRYDATLHIEHPSIDPDTVTRAFGMQPTRTHRHGDPRTTPNGQPLTGTYASNYWTCELQTADQQDITEFLQQLVTTFAPHRDFLADIARSAGEVCIFLGIFSDHCCAHQFENQLLHNMADIGFTLRLDFYGSQLPQKTGNATPKTA